MESSAIQEFYKGRSVLITGATGFCGKSLLEKLLRSCPDIGNIFVLMRPKKGQDVEKRLAKLFSDPVFDTVKRCLKLPLEHKVFPVPGDITQTGLGISVQNKDQLCREVSVVFHAAATIKFNENLRVALQTNVMGTQEVVELCKQMPLIMALVYVSTAYSQCPLTEIEEKVYPPPHDPKRLSECVDWLSEKDFHSIEPTPAILVKAHSLFLSRKCSTTNTKPFQALLSGSHNFDKIYIFHQLPKLRTTK
ncbi:hypothetical protein L9F63_011318 [Diploptera punctata]|uniref:Fatty acyl-CoA reductase n=1 Tax=Diploptera punctata TaxID=6984 RepID=A0AAD8EPI1_DIPPU|nr:hypothetical protein L9F63_011318 [Diploptera punctata]